MIGLIIIIIIIVIIIIIINDEANQIVFRLYCRKTAEMVWKYLQNGRENVAKISYDMISCRKKGEKGKRETTFMDEIRGMMGEMRIMEEIWIEREQRETIHWMMMMMIMIIIIIIIIRRRIVIKLNY